MFVFVPVCCLLNTQQNPLKTRISCQICQIHVRYWHINLDIPTRGVFQHGDSANHTTSFKHQQLYMTSQEKHTTSCVAMIHFASISACMYTYMYTGGKTHPCCLTLIPHLAKMFFYFLGLQSPEVLNLVSSLFIAPQLFIGSFLSNRSCTLSQ